MKVNFWLAMIAVLSSIPSELYAQSTQLTMTHRIKVPVQFSHGRDIPMTGVSDIERYVEGYERFWWACVKTRAKDINAHCDLFCSGTVAATEGCSDGAEAAMRHTDQMISGVGKKGVQEYLSTFLPALEEPKK